ncbi:hypothetical protein HZI73_14975 [Vallitalea pronyensis]|uniref:Uncharacterized protein n=1 Tax=Vallitalea pronyensis TaxID=1348613 RepID=A0A8J8ML40_9FIRM|nr:clostripain-related cysteine peptidase [Vallitalea pronyensis]QUI23506.1 hypothetical protein HZI73_14975 [Vallitalea pronyensis]
MQDTYNNSEYKKWTIFIYIAGNNDLEPYVYHQFSLLNEIVTNNQVHILIQISRAPREAKELDGTQSWCGTRRYVLHNDGVIMVENLGQVSMAKPSTLVDFLIWGSQHAPSKKKMLIMSGHSAGFVGLMKESTRKGNVLMGIHGFAKALHLFRQSSNSSIDLLVMDTCFMDAVEIWYGICMDALGTVKYALISHDNTPLGGIAYPSIINQLFLSSTFDCSSSDTYNGIIEALHKSHQERSLFCIQLHQESFVKLKHLIHLFSCVILQHGQDNIDKIFYNSHYKQKIDFISLSYLINSIEDLDLPIKDICVDIIETLNRIVVYTSHEANNRPYRGLKIYLPHNLNVYLKYKNIYDKLSFNEHNDWKNVLHRIHVK